MRHYLIGWRAERHVTRNRFSVVQIPSVATNIGYVRCKLWNYYSWTTYRSEILPLLRIENFLWTFSGNFGSSRCTDRIILLVGKPGGKSQKHSNINAVTVSVIFDFIVFAINSVKKNPPTGNVRRILILALPRRGKMFKKFCWFLSYLQAYSL